MEFRAFLVRMPSGCRYWTVVDACYRPVQAVDDFLLHLRLGRDRAESTTRAYATSIALFCQWCSRAGVAWTKAGGQLGGFMHWLQHYQPAADPEGLLVPTEPVRGARRVNAVLAAVREFLKHAAAVGAIDQVALDPLYEVVEDSYLPAEVRGERGPKLRIKPRHRLAEPERVVDAATDEEVVELVRACRNARDRFIVISLWRTGLRRGELAGLRREDVHLVPDASRLGCGVRGAHLHVVRRDNANGASAKSRRTRAVPADWLTVQAHDRYVLERDACTAAAHCDFALVNLYQQPLGRPLRPQAVNELLEDLCRRAGLRRQVHPHMLRHAFATGVSAAGGTIDELKELLGHAWLTSSSVYVHPSPERLRVAVDRVPSPRLTLERDRG